MKTFKNIVFLAILFMTFAYSSQKEISVGVKFLTGYLDRYDLPFSATIADLKAAISNKTNKPVETIRILYGGRRLDDKESIDEINKQQEIFDVVFNTAKKTSSEKKTT